MADAWPAAHRQTLKPDRAQPPARTLYASPLEMAQWLASARPGEEMKYATGPALDHREPAAILAGQWGRESAAHPFQKRRDGGVIDYHVRKLSPSTAEWRLPASARRPTDDAEWEASEQGRVYRLLCRCANLAQPCPSNQAVSHRLNLTDRNRAQYLIRQLCERGLIRLEAAAKLGPRVVRIVATGKCTPENNDTLGVKR